MAPRSRAATLVIGLCCAGLIAGCAPSDPAGTPSVERVVIITMPGVTWADVERTDLPNLRSLIDDSAIGAVSTRIGSRPASTTAGYLTIGAGTRAIVPGVDMGVALNPDELHGGVPASDLLRRRLERPVSGIAYIPVGVTIQANDDSPFAAEIGMLGDALEAGQIRRAVVANADAAEGFPTDQPPAGGAFSRSAATALMGSDGIVPGGSVGRGLLRDDVAAPFGRRLDQAAVLDVFAKEWDRSGPSVVLVEASDLSRAANYASRATPAQAEALRTEALRDSDQLLGEIVDRVDPTRDAVLVLAPVTPSTLGIAALRAPATEPGLLRSATTRRDGYVYLADVAPTILELVGIEVPTPIEGRPFDAVTSKGDRVELLATQARDASTRDERLPIVVIAIVAMLVALTIAVVRRDLLPAWLRDKLRIGAFAVLGLVPGTFVAAAVRVTSTSDLAYVAVVGAVAGFVAVICTLAERIWSGIGPIVAVGSVAGLIVADLVAGASLQVNSIFGYSMAVAGRFTGLGNLAFALLSAALVCLAVIVFDRHGTDAVPAIVGGLVIGVLVDGLPMLGADVGGIIATVPAFVLTVLVLRGHSITWRTVAASMAGALGVVVAFGVLDASQASGSQTHLARIGEHFRAGRLDSIITVLARRAQASFGNSQAIVVLAAAGVVAAALVQAALVATGRIRPGFRRPPWSPGGLALVVGASTLAVLGLVANDSSIAVPATMLIVIVPVVLLRELERAPS